MDNTEETMTVAATVAVTIAVETGTTVVAVVDVAVDEITTTLLKMPLLSCPSSQP